MNQHLSNSYHLNWTLYALKVRLNAGCLFPRGHDTCSLLHRNEQQQMGLFLTTSIISLFFCFTFTKCIVCFLSSLKIYFLDYSHFIVCLLFNDTAFMFLLISCFGWLKGLSAVLWFCYLALFTAGHSVWQAAGSLSYLWPQVLMSIHGSISAPESNSYCITLCQKLSTLPFRSAGTFGF